MRILHFVDRVHLFKLDFGTVEEVNVPALDGAYIFL